LERPVPIYEYQCQACGNEHEAIQKMSDEPLMICPSCGESELRKKISAAGFRLKGSGWYETDFKNSKKPETSAKSAETKSTSCCGSGNCSNH